MLIDQIFSEVNRVQHELISEEQLCIIREKEQTSGVAIWGTGRAGKYAVDFCRRYGVRPVCAVDNDFHAAGSSFGDLPLYSANEFYENYPDVFVIISCSYGYHIDQQLKEKGYQFLTFDTNITDQVTNRDSYENLLMSAKEEIEDIYTYLDDNISKEVFCSIIKYHLSLNAEYLSGLNNQNIYFDNDVIPSFSGELFVDCGAYTGDTLLAFHQSPKCFCKLYYALEPSHQMYERLKDTIQQNQIENVFPLEVGAWDRKASLKFSGNEGAANHIVETGSVEISVDSLDNLFYDQNVDFIKMDIEGAEMNALLGVQKIIQERAPILAISVYHKADDLWRIPGFVKSIQPNYQLYIRHHSFFGDDTVLYAIPRKMKS